MNQKQEPASLDDRIKKWHREVQYGEEAKRREDDEFWVGIFDTYTARQYVKIHKAQPGDTDSLVQAKARLDAREEIWKILTSAIERGTVAAGKLEAAKDAKN